MYLYKPHVDTFGFALNLTYPDGSEWGVTRFEHTARPALTTMADRPIVLRRPTPRTNRRIVGTARCRACRTRKCSLDRICAGHDIADGTRSCDCPRCGAPRAAIPNLGATA